MTKVLSLSLVFLSSCIIGFSQGISLSELEKISINLGEVINNNESYDNFHELDSLLKDVEIITLGEQSHSEGTCFQTKIKLIKYLHQNLGFDILAFETGLFDCYKAWQEMQKGNDVRELFGKSVQAFWSTRKEMIPLTIYIENNLNSESPLKLMGYDNQHYSRLSKDHLIADLSTHLKKTLPEILESKNWEHLKCNFKLLTELNIKQFKKNDPEQDTLFLNELIKNLKDNSSYKNTAFWVKTLESIKYFFSDIGLGTDFRDQQMAKNLIWIKESNPNSKIICWGATSHFLYNSEALIMSSPYVQLMGGRYYKKHTMMGDYLKDKYEGKLFSIGFTAYQGNYGMYRKVKLRTPKRNSLENHLGQLSHDNYLVPLDNLDIVGLHSRPLGNRYMKTDITTVMDAVIFNRDMKRPQRDNNFFLKMYPDNKHINPTTTESDTLHYR